MTLSDLILPMPLADCKDLVLVYSYEIAVTLYDLQQLYGDPRHVCYGRQLVDGRWMINGEILSMIGPHDLFGWAYQHINNTSLMNQIEVIPLAEALLLLPVSTGVYDDDITGNISNEQ